ncbi:MAG: hypothetical protein D6814_03300, partial [Calditrichaeota bacterium]
MLERVLTGLQNTPVKNAPVSGPGAHTRKAGDTNASEATIAGAMSFFAELFGAKLKIPVAPSDAGNELNVHNQKDNTMEKQPVVSPAEALLAAADAQASNAGTAVGEPLNLFASQIGEQLAFDFGEVTAGQPAEMHRTSGGLMTGTPTHLHHTAISTNDFAGAEMETAQTPPLQQYFAPGMADYLLTTMIKSGSPLDGAQVSQYYLSPTELNNITLNAKNTSQIESAFSAENAELREALNQLLQQVSPPGMNNTEDADLQRASASRQMKITPILLGTLVEKPDNALKLMPAIKVEKAGEHMIISQPPDEHVAIAKLIGLPLPGERSSSFIPVYLQSPASDDKAPHLPENPVQDLKISLLKINASQRVQHQGQNYVPGQWIHGAVPPMARMSTGLAEL